MNTFHAQLCPSRARPVPVVGGTCTPIPAQAHWNGGSTGEALGEMTDKLERAQHEHAALGFMQQ